MSSAKSATGNTSRQIVLRLDTFEEHFKDPLGSLSSLVQKINFHSVADYEPFGSAAGFARSLTNSMADSLRQRKTE